MPKIRIAALDLDGTLLSHENTITPRTRQAIADAVARGVVVLPATGRALANLPPLVAQLPGVRYAIASNGAAAVQNPRLDDAGLRPYFKGIFISEEMGADKPSKAFFDACFAAIPGFRLEETVMVGDSLTSDIRGGSNAGLRTVWFNLLGKEPRADIRPSYTIHALSELLPLLASTQ